MAAALLRVHNITFYIKSFVLVCNVQCEGFRRLLHVDEGLGEQIRDIHGREAREKHATPAAPNQMHSDHATAVFDSLGGDSHLESAVSSDSGPRHVEPDWPPRSLAGPPQAQARQRESPQIALRDVARQVGGASFVVIGRGCHALSARLAPTTFGGLGPSLALQYRRQAHPASAERPAKRRRLAEMPSKLQKILAETSIPTRIIDNQPFGVQLREAAKPKRPDYGPDLLFGRSVFLFYPNFCVTLRLICGSLLFFIVFAGVSATRTKEVESKFERLRLN